MNKEKNYLMKDPHHILKKTDQIGIKLEIEYQEREHSSAILFDLAHEHAKSIAYLIETNLKASAFALCRSCIEAYIRGSWLLHCATDDQVTRFTKKNTKWPSLSKQIKDLEQFYNKPDLLKRYMGKSMGLLDALTHGLSAQIKRRSNGNHIEFVVSDEEINELLWEVSYTSIIAHAKIAEIANDNDAIKKLESVLLELDISFKK